MKNFKIMLVAIAIFFGEWTFAQTIDTVSLQAGYSRTVWYSLEDDEQANVVKNDWDIAFDVTSLGASVWINSSIGTKLWRCSCDTSQFSSLDTSGISGWTEQINTDTSWQFGAFNLNITVPDFDLGWGTYSMITHTVIGDELFVIKLSNGSYQKIWIQELASGSYTFRHAALDNSMDMVHTLTKSLYSGKNFAYYSLVNHAAIDKEPLSSSWDLVFQQYSALDQGGYLVSGVVSNYGVEVAEVYPVNNPTSFNDWQNQSYSQNISTMGYDWKSYSGSWTLEDSLVFMVKSVDGDYWKLQFTGFGGSSNGNFIFSKEKLSTVSADKIEPNTSQLFLFPNPVNDALTLMLDADFGHADLAISDIHGKIISTYSFIHPGGMQTSIFSTTELNSGIYMLSIRINEQTHFLKFVKQ